jgi:iron complex outermembrane receptor protein
VRAEGFVNLPVNDANAVRIAGYTAKQNGWVDNVANEQNSLHDLDDQFVRAQYLFKPSDELSLKLRVEYWHGGGNGPGDFGYYVPGVPVNPVTGKTNGVSGVIRPFVSVDPSGFYQGGVPGLYAPTPADSDPQHIARNFPSERRVNQGTYSAELTAGVGFADFKAILSATDYQEYRQDDASFSAQPLWYNFNRVTAKTYTEEVQLISKSSTPVSWVIGAYLLQDKPTDFYVFGTSGFAPPQGSVAYPAQLFAPAFGVANPYAVDPNFYLQGPYRLDTKANAGYGDLTWSVIDTLRVIGGVRYTRDQKTGEYDNPDYIIDGAAAHYAEKTYSKTTWRGGLQYDVAPRSMLYVLASTGFQSGGFNGNPSLTPYDQTTVKAYEIGWKNVLFDGRLRANLAIYDNKYTNLLSQKLVTVGNAIQSIATNAGEVRAHGAELEVDWTPIDGAYLGLRSSYNHSRFGNFIATNSFTEGGTPIGGGQSIFQLEGQQVPLNPDDTVTLIGSYDLVSGSAGIFTPAATVYHSSSYRTSDQPYFFANQDAYTTFDVELRWRLSHDSRFSGELFCENCGDKMVLLRTTPNSGSVIYQDFSAPRMFGGRVHYRF